MQIALFQQFSIRVITSEKVRFVMYFFFYWKIQNHFSRKNLISNIEKCESQDKYKQFLKYNINNISNMSKLKF